VEIFFRHLKNVVPEVCTATIMIDRDKGLMSAEDVLGVKVTRLICLEHLRRNFGKKDTVT